MKSSFFSALAHAFPQPHVLRLDGVGIDISGSVIRVITFTQRAGKLFPKIVRECVVEVAPGAPITDKAYVKALSDIRKKYAITAAHITLPEEKAYIFSTELLPEAFANVRQAVAFKIEENVPITPAAAVYDFSVLLETVPGTNTLAPRSGEGIPVVVTVVPRESIDTYTSVFAEAGILVSGVQTQNQAVARAIIPDAVYETSILVNAHDGVADISMVTGHAVEYSSTVTTKDADVVDRVKRVLVFWQGRNKTHEGSKMPTTLYLAGADAADGKLAEALTIGIDIPVKIGNVWVNCFSFSEYVPVIEKARSHAFAAAIGAAMPHRTVTFD